MPTLPQLLEEDIRQIDASLRQFLVATDSATVLVIDKGGFLITNQGNSSDFDLTTIAALASGAYLATQTIANLVHEPAFNSTYQQGDNYSLFVMNVDEHALLVVIFPAQTGVGIVKYYAGDLCSRIAVQMRFARERNPDGGLDLSVMNMADPSAVFRKK